MSHSFRLRILFVCSSLLACSPASADPAYDPQRFEKQLVVAACTDPMQLEVLADGAVLFIERTGAVKLARPKQQVAKVIGKVPVAVSGEVGLMGLACDPKFVENGWIYVLFCPESDFKTLRLSRFTIYQNRIDLVSEVKLLAYPIDADLPVHMGGGLCFDTQGNLYIGTGDNTLPIPELPIDYRPGQSQHDAMRTSGNSMDLRGKILRISPQPDGSYKIPTGNLFSNPERGRPEIFAMGCRNPFRINFDPETGVLSWGDVGPNIQPDLGIGPNGYDEINRTTKAGNFGWPMFVGPNEVYRRFDFATRKVGAAFDLEHPLNDSPNNTGIRELPPPQPAFIWYPSGQSSGWPILGSGGRSAMAGPVYHHAKYAHSELRFPDEFDQQFFLFDWMRNWIVSATVNKAGELQSIQSFLSTTPFRKPIDLEFGPDGTLYIIEYGDKWLGNTDSQISRIVYRRDNRAPQARLAAAPLAGRQPLQVQLDASQSFDIDADERLTFTWHMNGQRLEHLSKSRHKLTLNEPGRYEIMVTATDGAGASSQASTDIRVGNEPPQVHVVAPQHGSFFDWGQTIRYRIEADDAEDGSTNARTIAAGRVFMTQQLFARRPASTLGSAADDVLANSSDPGLALMRQTTCFSCHTAKTASAGPAYRDIAMKYVDVANARERLAEKIVTGGAGVWGRQPMPPHPQHSLQQTRLMVDWILSLAHDESAAPVPGTHGFFRPAPPRGATPSQSGVLLLTAEYTDEGAANVAGVLPLRREATCVLHTRRKHAAFSDARQGAELIDVFERKVGLVARFSVGDWISFRDVCLADIDRVTWSAGALQDYRGTLVLRSDSPTGPEVARVLVEGTGDPVAEAFSEQVTSIVDPGGVHDIYIVAEPTADPSPRGHSLSSSKAISLAWLEFHESPAAAKRKQEAEDAAQKIVLIPTELDHPWATHMYTKVCQLLAACLNQTPGVEAVVSPDLDWPRDERLLEGADAIVYYSRPAGDIVLSPQHRQQFQAMLARGVGFTAIHWSTGADEQVGLLYREILGGWFNFAFSGLKVDQRPLEQVLPEHPICRGWSPYILRDEFYLNLKFSDQAEPVLRAKVDGQDQTVAWVLNRPDGGRSFGTTLGHFHENFGVAEFRQMLVNGILWTAQVEIPESGASIDIDRALLELEKQTATRTQEWQLDDLLPLLDRPLRNRSFARGEELFQRVSCASCHSVNGAADKLGPDLTDVRVRMAKYADPRAALLREIVEPSHIVDEKYLAEIFMLASGKVVSGLVRSETSELLQVATDPAKPTELLDIAVEDIDERERSELSMMPAGLLNTLTKEDIIDLFAYVESGGNPSYVAFSTANTKIESWADQRLPVKNGLQWWLDARQINASRSIHELSEIGVGQQIDIWPDASGHERHAIQRNANSMPHVEVHQGQNIVRFDGVDDYMSAGNTDIETSSFTAVVVVRPDDNQGWPGLISANAIGRNDYQSGFNIDLMNAPTNNFEAIMTEGSGYPGVINLMQESHSYGQFFIVTVSSEPGSSGVRLRINGRQQQSRDRPPSEFQFDAISIGARYWSNDRGIPPYVRGFLHGAIAQVLLYNRALADDELVATEVFLWESNRELLDPLQAGSGL